MEDTEYRKMGHELIVEFGSMHRRLSRRMDSALRGEMAVLRALALAEGSLTPSELADRAHISSARVANILRVLEEKGLIERKHSQSDRRRVHVELTIAGQAKIDEKREEFEGHVAEFLELLGADDTREMVRLLKRTNKIIEQHAERRAAQHEDRQAL